MENDGLKEMVGYYVLLSVSGKIINVLDPANLAVGFRYLTGY
jgi:hypothetical protein